MSRRSARKNAFYLLFQMDFNETEEFEQVKTIFFEEVEEAVEEEEKAFILSEVAGTQENLAEIDALIGESAKGWDTGRMSKVDLAICVWRYTKCDTTKKPLWALPSTRRLSLPKSLAPMKPLPLSMGF